ncbi:MAG: type I 3-dehydroquinate dehydratase [Clostridia bacterium]|nr:type I 3-dehydroquinate dehydratase [Clostridia bacterium]
MNKTFLKYDKPTLTTMVQADNPDRIKELIDKSNPLGAEAFGMQFCRMKEEYRNKETYKMLFSYAGEKPVYVTNYRYEKNNLKKDQQLADELVEFAECGATLCDVMGDIFDKQPGELTMDENAVKKQIKLIDELHNAGAEVLMSSHVFKFTPAERVLKIALEHQRRGADICKIVTGAETMEQQIENLRIINMLKENLEIPFLFLCGGECNILRRIGGNLGCCMYLCVYEYDEFSTNSQPILKELKAIRDNFFTA